MYLRHYDERFGDVYEIYVNDITGDFQGALRSPDHLGSNTIHYERLDEIPLVQRGAIENLIQLAWERKHKS